MTALNMPPAALYGITSSGEQTAGGTHPSEREFPSMSLSLLPRRKAPWPLRRPIQFGGTLGMVVCICLVLLATAARDLWRVYQNNIEQTQIATATATRLVAEQADTTMQTADTIVASLVERVEAEGVDPDARNRLYRLMTSLAAALPAIHEMGITDRDGNAIVKSLKPDPTGLNYSERGYFKFHASHPDRGPFVGARIKSKIDGSYNVTVTRRLNDADGSFAGVVVTSVSMQAFQRLFDQMQARSGGVIALLSEDGTILARSPPATDDGASPAGTDLQQLVSRQPGPSPFADVSGIDGLRRLGSYQHLDHFPLTVLVSQSEWDVQHSWRQELLSQVSILMCMTAVLIVLGRRELKSKRMLSAQAMQDGLTGLANRRRFDEQIEREFRRAARSGQPVSLVVIDLDHFKAYNDHFGHLGGDECLRTTARAIQAFTRRSGDLAARIGGEEFAILLPGSDAAEAKAIAEEVRMAVQGLALPHAPTVGGMVTLSAGVATAMPAREPQNTQALIERADAALYVGKVQGRNVVVVAGAGQEHENLSGARDAVGLAAACWPGAPAREVAGTFR
jgi:diguanylate cyclase (GGDEF)-like protein